MKIKPSDIRRIEDYVVSFTVEISLKKVSHYFSALFIRLDISPNFIGYQFVLMLIIPISILILSTSYYLFIFGCFLLMLIRSFMIHVMEKWLDLQKTSSSGII